MKQLKTPLLFLLLVLAGPLSSYAQETKYWTEADRQYLLENLTRSRDELIAETKGLSKAQWSFKESPDRWSINEIVEHIALWEMLLCHRVASLLQYDPHPERVAEAITDDEKFTFIMEEKPHHSPDYTQPYTYTIPMGINDMKNNMAWLLKLRKESIDYVSIAKVDLRAYFFPSDNTNPHGTYITMFGHTDRHLRQLRKVKQHVNYPKK